MTTNPWKTVKKNIISQNKFGYTLHDDDVITPSGNPGKYMVLEKHGFVVIVALNSKNQVIMTKQWRYPVEKEFIELPAGNIEYNEDPLKTAQRELFEETGAVSDDWTKLGFFWIGNGAMKIKGHFYLAKNISLRSGNKQDSTEKITVRLISYNKLIKLIKNYKIDEDRTALGLLLAQNYL